MNRLAIAEGLGHSADKRAEEARRVFFDIYARLEACHTWREMTDCLDREEYGVLKSLEPGDAEAIQALMLRQALFEPDWGALYAKDVLNAIARHFPGLRPHLDGDELDELVDRYADLCPERLVLAEQILGVPFSEGQERRDRLAAGWELFALRALDEAKDYTPPLYDDYDEDTRQNPLDIIDQAFAVEGRRFDRRAYRREIQAAIGDSLRHGNLTQANALIAWAAEADESDKTNALSLSDYQAVYARHRDDIEAGYVAILEQAAIRSEGRADTFSDRNIERINQCLGFAPDWRAPAVHGAVAGAIRECLAGDYWLSDAWQLSRISGIPLPEPDAYEAVQRRYLKNIERGLALDLEKELKIYGYPLRVDEATERAVEQGIRNLLWRAGYASGDGDFWDAWACLRRLAPTIVTDAFLGRLILSDAKNYSPEAWIDILGGLRAIGTDVLRFPEVESAVQKMMAAALMGGRMPVFEKLQLVAGRALRPESVPPAFVADTLFSMAMNNDPVLAIDALDAASAHGLLSPETGGVLRAALETNLPAMVGSNGASVNIGLAAFMLRAGVRVPPEEAAALAAKVAETFVQHVGEDWIWRGSGTTASAYLRRYAFVMRKLGAAVDWRVWSDHLGRIVSAVLSSENLDEVIRIEEVTGIRPALNPTALSAALRRRVNRPEGIAWALRPDVRAYFKDELSEAFLDLLDCGDSQWSREKRDAFKLLCAESGVSVGELAGAAARRRFAGWIAAGASVEKLRLFSAVSAGWGLPPELFLPTDEAYASARYKRSLEVWRRSLERSGYLTESAQDPYVSPLTNQEREDVLYTVVQSATYPGAFAEALTRAGASMALPFLNDARWRPLLREKILQAFSNGVTLSDATWFDGLDADIFSDREARRVVEALIERTHAGNWIGLVKRTGVRPDFERLPVRKAWANAVASKWLSNRGPQLAGSLDLESLGAIAVQRGLIQFSMFDPSLATRLVTSGLLVEIEQTVGKSLNDPEVFEDVLALKDYRAYQVFLRQRGAEFSEAQRIRFAAAARALLVDELVSGQENRIFTGYASLVKADRSDWGFDEAQKAAVAASYGSQGLRAAWMDRFEATGIAPDFKNPKVRTSWEECLFSASGRDRSTWSEIERHRRWSMGLGWDGVWAHPGAGRSFAAIASACVPSKDVAHAERFERVFGFSFAEAVAVELAFIRNRYGEFRVALDFLRGLEAFAPAFVSLADIRAAAGERLDGEVRRLNWANVAHGMKEFGLRPSRACLGGVLVDGLSKPDGLPREFLVLCRGLGERLVLNAEDLRAHGSRFSIRTAAMVYANFLPPEGIERASAIETFRGLDPKFACVADLMALQGPSARPEFCPYAHKVGPLLDELTAAGVSFAEPASRKALFEFCRRFGVENRPVLARTVIDILAHDDQSQKAAYENLRGSASSFVAEAVRLVGLRADDRPRMVLDRLQEFQAGFARSLLADEDLPVGFESCRLAMELFNSFVPSVGDYASIKGREEVIAVSRRSRGLRPPRPKFLATKTYDVLAIRDKEKETEKYAVPDQALAKISEAREKKAKEEPFLAFLKPWREAVLLWSRGGVALEPDWWFGRIRARWEVEKSALEAKLAGIIDPRAQIALRAQVAALERRSEALDAQYRHLAAAWSDGSERGELEKVRALLRGLVGVFTDERGRTDRMALARNASNEVYGLAYRLVRSFAEPHFARIEAVDAEADPVAYARAWTGYFYQEYLEHFTRTDVADKDRQMPPDLAELFDSLWKTKGTIDGLRAAGEGGADGPAHPVANVAKALRAYDRAAESLAKGEAVEAATCRLTIHPVTGVARAFAGDIANACYNKHRPELAAGGFPHITGLLFSLEGYDQIAGSVLCVEGRKRSGGRVLLIRALNPTEAVSQRRLDAEATVRAVTDYFIEAANASATTNPGDPVVEVRLCHDHSGGHSTNRSAIFEAEARLLAAETWGGYAFGEDLESTPETNFNNNYQVWRSKETRVIWKRQPEQP